MKEKRVEGRGKLGPRRALVLDGGGPSRNIEQDLKLAARALNCDSVSTKNANDFFLRLKEEAEAFDFIALNPSAEGFNVEETLNVFQQLESRGIPPVLLVGGGKGHLYDFAKAFSISAEFDEKTSVYQMGFVLNQIFFPCFLEKRECARTPLELDVEMDFGKGLPKQKTRILNISAGGAYVQTDRTYSERSLVNLTIHLPSEMDPVECTGRVVYNQEPQHGFPEIRPQGMGVHFEGINFSDVTRLKILVDANLMPFHLLRL